MYDEDSADDASSSQGGLTHGRRAMPWTDSHDWVGLAAGVSPAAHSLYVKLKMHLNHERGDALVWPGQIPLAMMMTFDKVDSLSRYMAQLEAVGAVDIDRRGLPARCYYTLHDVPAEAYCAASGYPVAVERCKPCAKAETEDPCKSGPYAGPTTIKQWYAANRAEIEVRKASVNEKRADRRERKRAKGQVTPDSPSTGRQAEDPGSAAPDSPSTGRQADPDDGRQADPPTGREQERKEQQLKELGGTLPPSPLRPQDPPTSDLGNDAKPDSYGRTGLHGDVDGDHRPRARAQIPEDPGVDAGPVGEGSRGFVRQGRSGGDERPAESLVGRLAS